MAHLKLAPDQKQRIYSRGSRYLRAKVMMNTEPCRWEIATATSVYIPALRKRNYQRNLLLIIFLAIVSITRQRPGTID